MENIINLDNSINTSSNNTKITVLHSNREPLKPIIMNTLGHQSKDGEPEKIAQKSEKVSDESSDSSLDYGSANEDGPVFDHHKISSLESDGRKSSTFLTPKVDLDKSIPDSVPSNKDFKSPNITSPLNPANIQEHSGKKQLIYNPLTETFESPNSTFNKDFDESFSEQLEVGQDPLNTRSTSPSIVSTISYQDNGGIVASLTESVSSDNSLFGSARSDLMASVKEMSQFDNTKDRRISESSILVIESDVNKTPTNTETALNSTFDGSQLNEHISNKTEIDVTTLAKLDLDSGFQIQAVSNMPAKNNSNSASHVQTDYEPMDVEMFDDSLVNDVLTPVEETKNTSTLQNNLPESMDYEEMDVSMTAVDQTLIIQTQTNINDIPTITEETLVSQNNEESAPASAIEPKLDDIISTITNEPIVQTVKVIDNIASLNPSEENDVVIGISENNTDFVETDITSSNIILQEAIKDKTINENEDSKKDENEPVVQNDDASLEIHTKSIIEAQIESAEQQNIQLNIENDVFLSPNVDSENSLPINVDGVNEVIKDIGKSVSEAITENIHPIPVIENINETIIIENGANPENEINPFVTRSRIVNTPEKISFNTTVDSDKKAEVVENILPINTSVEDATENCEKDAIVSAAEDIPLTTVTPNINETIIIENGVHHENEINPFFTRSRVVNTPEKNSLNATVNLELNASNINNHSLSGDVHQHEEENSEHFKATAMNELKGDAPMINTIDCVDLTDESIEEVQIEFEKSPNNSPTVENSDTNITAEVQPILTIDKEVTSNETDKIVIDEDQMHVEIIDSQVCVAKVSSVDDIPKNETDEKDPIPVDDDHISESNLDEQSPSFSPNCSLSDNEIDDFNSTIKVNPPKLPESSEMNNETFNNITETSIREMRTPERNGNVENDIPQVLKQPSPSIDLNQNTPKMPTRKIEACKSNFSTSINNLSTSVDSFISPMLKDKNIDRLVAQKKLSPMSRSGDLMGLSPVTQGSTNVHPINRNIQTQDILMGNNNVISLLDDFDEEEFKDPNEVFKDPAAFDFLQSCATSGKPGRDFGKESLFVKFDPLVGGSARFALPEGPRHTALVEQEESVSPAVSPKTEEDASIASGLVESCSSDSSCTYNSDLGKSASKMSSVEHSVQPQQLPTSSNVSPLLATEKPTQVVTPAISTRHQYTPSTPHSARSSSSAIAAIDRLISLGSNSPLPPPPPVVVQPKEPEMDPRLLQELQSVRELLAKQEEELRQSNEYSASLQKQLTESATREQALIDSVNEKNKDHRKMDLVMEEYERTMSALIGEREMERKQWADERIALIKERDEVTEHLANMEHSFNDIHSKYEKCKVMIQGYKTNEEFLKQTVASNEEASKKHLERYDQLRQHAMSQLEIANQEIESVKKSHQNEMTRLQAMLKKAEFQSSSLQETLTQKTKDIEELTAICDELINKVA